MDSQGLWITAALPTQLDNSNVLFPVIPKFINFDSESKD